MTSDNLTFTSNHIICDYNRFLRWWIRFEGLFCRLCFRGRYSNHMCVSGRGSVTSYIWPMTSSVWPLFDLWPVITGSNIDLGPNTKPPIASIRREQSAGLFREALRRFVWKRQGGGVTPPCPTEDGETPYPGGIFPNSVTRVVPGLSGRSCQPIRDETHSVTSLLAQQHGARQAIAAVGVMMRWLTTWSETR